VYPPGSQIVFTNYLESGMSFRPLPGYSGFGRAWPGITNNPDDGTAFLKAALAPPQNLMFSFTNGSLFGLVAVDLSQYSTVLPNPVTVPFIGFRPDGSTVTNSFITPGYSGTGPLTFQTYLFGPEFAGVSRVEIPTSGWSLDNLVVSGVNTPEPSPGSLMVLAAVLSAARWRGRRRMKRPKIK